MKLPAVRGRFMEGVHPDDRLLLLDRAVASSEHGVVIVDLALPDLPIVYVNPAFGRLTGYPAEEALSRNCRFLQGDDREQPGLDEVRAAIRERRTCEVQLRNYRRDGTPFDNNLNVAPVFDAAGKATHFVGVQHDVTRRVTAELEVRRLNRELERIAAERGHLLADLHHRLAHDMRSPLTSLSGLAAMLEEELRAAGGPDGEALRRVVGRIVHNVEEAYHVVDRALETARLAGLEADRLGLEGRTRPSDMGGLTGFSSEAGAGTRRGG